VSQDDYNDYGSARVMNKASQEKTDRKFKLEVRLTQAAIFLNKVAYELDQWADQSRKWGWSTHQVANINMANACRREASQLMDMATGEK
jgi:hypothetical protein